MQYSNRRLAVVALVAHCILSFRVLLTNHWSASRESLTGRQGL